MKVLVTGVGGQLGYEVMKELARRGMDAVGADKKEFDVTDAKETEHFISACRPDAVVHCGAFTAVDKAETERELCRAVNVDGTAHIAKVCAEIGAKMVYISTDYVFDGTGTDFHKPDDPTAPLNFYGLTK